MTTLQAIKNIVARIRSDSALSEQLADTADLVEDVGLDSLETLQLMLELESTLGVQIDFDKMEFSYLRSLSALADFLDTMPASPAAGGRS